MLVEKNPDEVCKRSEDVLGQSRSLSNENTNEHDNVETSGTVVLQASQSYENVQDLQEKTTSLMERTLTRNSKGKPLFACRLCDKRSAHTHEIRRHIEANHLEEVSLPCKLCGKIFKSTNSLSVHIHREHKGCKYNI